MTVGQVIEALERYGRDRSVAITSGIGMNEVVTVRSIEPDDLVLLVCGPPRFDLFSDADRAATGGPR